MTEEVDWYQYDTAAFSGLGHPPGPLRPAGHIHTSPTTSSAVVWHLAPK